MSTSLITIFKYSNIGNTVVTVLTDLLGKSGFTGLTLVLALYGISIATTLLVPSAIANWSIMNNAVTTTMNAGISPIFTQFVFRMGQCVTICLTPLFSYFVIYLAYFLISSHKGILQRVPLLLPSRTISKSATRVA